MANEIRARFNFVSGTLSGALTNVATSMSAAGLANLGVIDSTNYAAIAIENEIVWVTAHTAGATTATILRAQEGTAAAAHNSGVAWQHGPTAADVPGDWTLYTPTLTQSATVTKTVTYAKYMKIGRKVTVIVALAVTGAGTAANDVAIGLPVTGVFPDFLMLGVGEVFDTSAGGLYKGFVEIQGGGTTVKLLTAHATTLGALGGTTFTAALASGDVVRFSATYESVS